MFVHEQFAIGQVGVELGDVGLGVGDIRGAAEVVGVVEEDVLVRGVGRHVAVTGLHVVGVFGLVPLYGRTGRRAGYGVALGAILLAVLLGIAPWILLGVLVVGIPIYKHIQQFKAVQDKKTTFALAIKNMVMIHSLQIILLLLAIFLGY